MKNKYQEPDVKGKSLSQADQDTLTFVNGRFQDMRTQRALVDKNWRIYQKQIDAIYRGYQDGRSSSVVPLASALIELGVAEELAMPLDYKFKAEEEQYEAQRDTLEEVWKRQFRVYNYQWEELKASYDCWGIGTSVEYLHFERTIQEQNNATIDGLFDLTFKKEYLVKNDILLDRFDYRRFYPDNRVNNFDEAVDCVAIQIIPYETFLTLKNNPAYKNIEAVSPMNYFDGNLVNPSQEEMGKNGKFVQLINYWNREKDMYCVVANNQQIIRQHPIMTYRKGEKALPFVMRQLSYKENSLWGRGLCELCMSFQSQVNNYNELLMDGVKRSNLEIIAIGSGLTLKNNRFQYGNKIMEFEGDINRLKQLTGTPPSQALFNGLDRLYTDIAVYTGLDVRNIIGDTTPTKFQAELQRESSLKRVRTWMKNRDMSAERKSDILQDLIQRYYWVDKSRRLVDSLENYKPETPEIELDGKKYNGNSKKFTKTPEGTKSKLTVSQDMLKGELYVDVFTNDSTSTSNAIHRENVLQFMQSLPMLFNSYQTASTSGMNLTDILPLQDTVQELASNFDINVKSKTQSKELNQKKNEAMDKLKALGANL